ncbi:type I-B CRISPR-associated protein Cas8b1/Cst1 [Candidatus Poribacteria bacterium]|nr:type I-B CRISPR-associated protein Cas8b1/Cst1 [Candidatus Poribacteria bacterium]
MPIYEKLMGNPFVDAGVCGICEWLERRPQPEEITTTDLEVMVEEFIPMAAKWEKWGSIFTLNHSLTNPSKKKDERLAHFRGMLLDYIHNVKELDQIGDCMGCGRRDVGSTPLLDKTGVPLTGGKNSNFFPVFSEGAGYCPACSFSIQFLPFSLVATGKNGGRFLMLHSKSWELMRIWTIRCIQGIKQQYSQQQSGECFKPDYENSRNGLFYMVREMIIECEEMQLYDEITDKDVSMEVYSFTNNNQFPDIEIFYIPSSVFQFLSAAEQNPYKDAWYEIVQIGYGRGKSKKDYKKSRNLVYEYLLEDRSIRGFFLSRRTQKHRGNWELFSLYLQKVRNMKPTRIEKIKQVGDLIAESIRKSEKRGLNRLQDLENATTYFDCRSVLLRIIRDRIVQKEPEPLFSFDDCVEHIFISADNAQSWSDELDDSELDEEEKEQLRHSINDNVRFWRETRDLLLFRIYEQLHSWLTEQEDN